MRRWAVEKKKKARWVLVDELVRYTKCGIRRTAGASRLDFLLFPLPLTQMMINLLESEFAKRWAKSEGGQALIRGAAGMGGEGLEEIASGFADPALQGIYNGKTLGENYRELNMADLLHDGAVGMLLGNLGGGVDIAWTMSGNPRSNLSYTDVLNKTNLSTPDNYAMNRAGNIAIGAKTDYTENDKTEAQDHAKVYVRDSSEWLGGAYSRGQVSAVEEGTGRTSYRQAALRPADSEAASLTFGKAVSAASLGIDGGSEQATIHLLRGDETLCTAKAKRIASDRGLQLVLFAGDNLHITQANGTTVSVRGYISGNRVFVRADHPRYTSEQIVLHEAGHNMIAMGAIDLDEVRDYIAENSNVGKTAQFYMDAYAGTDMTADEIWEELICDSLGNMNIFSEILGEEVAQEYLMETRRAVEAVQHESVGSRALPVDGKMSRDRLIDGNFPPYNESQSDANERATRWAHSDDVQAGDQKIASYHGRWYLIEAFDDADLGYRIVERLNKSQYNALVKEMQKHDNVPGVQKGFDRIVELDKG